jgi:hypothetical protein
LEIGATAGALDDRFLAGDVDCTITFGEFEDGKGVEGWCALDIAGSCVEAGCKITELVFIYVGALGKAN